MRIVSKFKDYYDIGMSEGHSDPILYVRTAQDVRITVLRGSGWRDDMLCREFAVGFCGKVYHGLLLADKTYTNQLHVYNITDLDDFVDSYCPGFSKSYWEKAPRFYRKSRWIPTRQHFANYFEGFQINYKGERADILYPDYFRQYNAPIWVYDDGILHVNCLLREYEFFRVFEPWQCFQEVSMYVGGVLLGNNKKIPEIDNDTLIEAKGFDLKTSFRKDKSK